MLTQRPKLFFPPPQEDDHILFLEAQPDKAIPGYATMNKPCTLTKPLWPLLFCTHRSFPLLFMRRKQQNGSISDCTCIGELQRWPLHFFLLFDSVLFLIHFQQSSGSCAVDLSVPLFSIPVLSSWAQVQTSPCSQSYVVLRLGPPGLLTDFCRVLVGGNPCPGIWPCPPSVAG